MKKLFAIAIAATAALSYAAFATESPKQQPTSPVQKLAASCYKKVPLPEWEYSTNDDYPVSARTGGFALVRTSCDDPAAQKHPK